MRPREKTHCVHGHSLSAGNVWRKRRGPWLLRICKACDRAKKRRTILRRVRGEIETRAA
jgi:hypothetical protein